MKKRERKREAPGLCFSFVMVQQRKGQGFVRVEKRRASNEGRWKPRARKLSEGPGSERGVLIRRGQGRAAGVIAQGVVEEVMCTWHIHFHVRMYQTTESNVRKRSSVLVEVNKLQL